MSELSVPNPLPVSLIVLSMELIEQKDRLINLAHNLSIENVDQQQLADKVAKEMADLFNSVEEQRLAFGRQLRAIQGKVKDAADEALKPLQASWDALALRIKAFVQAENARREAEAKRIRDEQETRQREEDARAETARIEAQRQADLDAPPGEVAEPVSLMDQLPARVKAADPIPKAIKSSAFSTRKGADVVIENEALIPLEINGLRLWKEVSIANVKTLLKAGITVPGCRLETGESMSMRSH